MKRLLTAIFAISLMGLSTFAQDKKPASPPRQLDGAIDGVQVSVYYSSPSVKGRTIWGDLVPYDKVWRAGANKATWMEFSKDVKIDGQKLAAGKYAFFVKPSKEGEWTIYFNSEWDQWGAYGHKPKQDVLVIKTKPMKSEKMEQLTYAMGKDDISLHWDEMSISFKVAKL